MCFSFKEISLRSVSPPLFVFKQGVACPGHRGETHVHLNITEAAGSTVAFMASVTLCSIH